MERARLEGRHLAERDACGVGFLAEMSGEASERVLSLALTALARMGHRGAVDADGRTGDGPASPPMARRFVVRAADMVRSSWPDSNDLSGPDAAA